MSALDLTEFEPDNAMRVCAVGRALEAMSDEDRLRFVAALSGPFQTVRIQERLAARGFEMASSTVTRHRKGRCGCER